MSLETEMLLRQGVVTLADSLSCRFFLLRNVYSIMSQNSTENTLKAIEKDEEKGKNPQNTHAKKRITKSKIR